MHSEPEGFAEAQADYENQHPDDHLCPCYAEHENKGDDAGYNLRRHRACGHDECHEYEDWWPARDYIVEGFINNEKELKIVLGLFEEHDELTDEMVDAVLKAFR